MKSILTALCTFTMLASGWLCVMYFVLRHPGYQWRAAVAAGFFATGIVTLSVVHAARPVPWLRGLAVLLGVAILVVGGDAIITNHTALDYEGYWDAIGLALVAQGLLTIVWVARNDPNRKQLEVES